MLVPKPRILFIDAYDSFSNNIISLLETTLDAPVRTIKIDDPKFESDEDLHKELRHYDAVVCGPGPGHPAKEEDVGITKRIWSLSEERIIPVLGVCLGFQSLCLEFGGQVRRLKGPQHGIVRRISHVGECRTRPEASIFSGVGEVQATMYQSLCADVGQDSIPDDQWQGKKWCPSKSAPDLVPLAWAEADLSNLNDSGVDDVRVLVAVRHATKPFWALQYHPESICTNEESSQIIENWFQEVQGWNMLHKRHPAMSGEPLYGQNATRESLLHRSEQLLPMLNGSAEFPYGEHFSTQGESAVDEDSELVYHCHTMALPASISVVDVVEAIQVGTGVRHDQIVLESSNAYEQSIGTADVRGRFSIIAMDVEDSLRFDYTVQSHQISAHYPGKGSKTVRTTDLRQFGGIWPFLAQYLEKRRIAGGNSDSPFWGGFMGYTTYEIGLETIGVQTQGRRNGPMRPDLSLAWVTRSVVVDHVRSVIHVQELAPRDATRHVLDRRVNFMMNLQIVNARNSSWTPAKFHKTPFESGPSVIHLPHQHEYESKVQQCQEFIRSGNSYELCLTDQTTVTRSKNGAGTNDSSWDIYKTLRKRQPAPFASYIRLGSATLVSSSPERFLKWDEQGKCELRPMKGTVRKSETVDTLAAATALLDVPKEKAENLMIVDLVRHDLHGVCGSGNVQVPRLMVVEEYKSVFQMISIVQGQILPAVDHRTVAHMTNEEIDNAERIRHTGIDVFAASLPPGSMTGAPKKRSCEILQEIEGGQERSLYSGVAGYMDVGGRGDWSVTIRSMFRWDDEHEADEGDPKETWHIGAGGAVTALSTPVGEREEMQTKLNGTLGLFR
ncbi:ADC synthase [Amylocarpus encephaloides]|uniref:aminodeoxychorismate synthase n=1 Tax=Amylocarpus encephaloides TaxID=45428 RepID=A0A9P8C104_9HELO|nr:ADC synthase [Amylocarpus encephaloides]